MDPTNEIGKAVEEFNQAQNLTPEQEATKNLVVAKMNSLNQLRLKKRQLKERLDSLMMGDEAYKVALTDWNTKRKELKDIKERLAQQPDIFELKEELKEVTQDFNQTKKDISEYLLIFQTETGQLSFIDPNGHRIEIVQSATPRIVKVSTFKRRQN